MPQAVVLDMALEVRVPLWLLRRSSGPRSHQPNPLFELLTHTTQGFGNVAVVAHCHRAVMTIEPAIIRQMYGEIDLRSFLLRPNRLRRVWWALQRLRTRRWHLVPEKVPKVNFHFRSEMLRGAEINILPLRLGRIRRGAGDSRSKVLDLEEVVMQLQNRFEQSD